MYGYAGKMLFAHLDNHWLEDLPLYPNSAKKFLGGYGIGARFLYEHMPAHTDAFDKKSIIGFISGPLNNTAALFGGRYTVVCKSPVTGGFNDANSGGHFGGKLKKSGYDAIFVDGISEKPVYILVNRGKAKICDASDLWGLTTKETEEILQKRHGKNAGIALIGPAGENKSFISAIMNDGHRAAARGGPGAVMGSKNLKAIVVKGSKITFAKHPLRVLFIDIETLIYVVKQLIKGKTDEELRTVTEFPKYGTGGSYLSSVLSSDTGIKNWSGVHPTDPTNPDQDSAKASDTYDYNDAVAQSSQGLEQYKTKRYTCAQCPVHCSAFMTVTTKRWGKLKTTRPEYETMGAFGSLLTNKDIESVFMANELCNEYGFDTMSAGGTLGWAMDCYNNGVLTKDELDGIELTWGNGNAVVAILEKMCKNEGIGAILAKGSREAARLLGKGSEYLVTASGIEQPQHDARLFYGLGRTYMVDPTPGRHVKASIGDVTYDQHGIAFDPERHMRGRGPEEVRQVVHTEIMNTSGACAQGYGFGNPYDAIIRNIMALTGNRYSHDDLTLLGLRIFTMRQLFNIREGIFRSDLTMSERMKKGKPPYDGILKDIDLDFDMMVDSFYDALGWKRDGTPNYWAIKSLGGFKDIIGDFYEEPAADTRGGETKFVRPAEYYTGRRPKKT